MSVTKLSNRLIAFADILGFSDRLKTTPIEDIHAIYSALCDHASTHIFVQDDDGDPGHSNFARAQFLFDSVVLVSNPLDGERAPRSANDFFCAAISLFESSLGHALPLRGAITIGDVLEDETRRIVLSPVIPQLLAAEKEQEWAGILVLPAAVEPSLRALYGLTDANLLRGCCAHVVRHDVPTKSGYLRDSYVLNWPYLCSQQTIDVGLDFLTGRKRTETEVFSRRVRGAAPGEALAPELHPAARMLVRVSQVGFTIQIHDAQGNGVDLPSGTVLDFVAGTTDGRRIKYAVTGEGKPANPALNATVGRGRPPAR